MSQAQLSALTGVAPSEIHRVEVGQQECRIETFLKLCGPLGVAPGWVLDRVLQTNIGEYRQRISQDADFKQLRGRLKVGDQAAGILASACTLAAILVRASLPVERTEIESFPQEEWKGVFLAFAKRLEKMGGDNMERAAILHNLLAHPVAELSRQGLIVESVIKEQAVDDGRLSRKNYLWLANDVRFPRVIKW